MKHSNIKLEEITKKIFRFNIPEFKKLNDALYNNFLKHINDKNTRKSHFFKGRHENIYISSDVITEIKTILSLAKECVQKITGKTSLQSGLWFNYMEPGQVTLAHSHDEADEIYSAAYYVKVPENSGDLIITENKKDITIPPKEGSLVLFPPYLAHQVTINNSTSARLSVGINIGK